MPRRGTTGPLENWLGGQQAAAVSGVRIPVSAVQVARVRHDGQNVTWRTVETIAVGHGRRMPHP